MSENPGEKFFNLVVKVLISNKFEITALQQESKDLGYDVIGKEAGEKEFPIGIKYYRTERAQPSLIAAAAESLIKGAVLSQFKHAVLVVSSVVEPTIKISLEKRFQIRILDKLTLLSMALSEPRLYDSLIAIDESNTEISQNPEIPETNKNKLSLDELIALNILTGKKERAKEGLALSNRLRSLPRGKADSVAYEKLCVDILKFLFNEYLKLWVVENRTQDGLHRFDLICSVSPRNAFWSFVENRLSSRYVVFEFKNYTEEVGQGQVLTTEKYLLPLAFRRLAIILSREGANNSAFKSAEGAMRESGKLILILDDNHLHEMLEMKDVGGDPSDVLLDLADEFLTGLGR